MGKVRPENHENHDFPAVSKFHPDRKQGDVPTCHSRPGRRNLGLGGAHSTHFPAVTPYWAFPGLVTLLSVWSCGSSQQRIPVFIPVLIIPRGTRQGGFPEPLLLAQMVCVWVKHTPTNDRGMVTMVGKKRAGETPGIWHSVMPG